AERRAMVVLDLRKLTFMDSAGVHVIVNASVRARQAGCRLVLVRGPAQVDRIFTLTGAADVLEIGDLDSVEAPLQVLARLSREDYAG
ncbi:MAG: STAS domain-containing protein, partial [Actinomycetota bacterium]|nr:STAS domain-containing protein [Actinomycetota bacterium]